VTVALCDPTVLVVNPKLGSLISADLSAAIDCSFLGVVVASCATASTPLYIPASAWVWNNMVAVRSFLLGHRDLLFIVLARIVVRKGEHPLRNLRGGVSQDLKVW